MLQKWIELTNLTIILVAKKTIIYLGKLTQLFFFIKKTILNATRSFIKTVFHLILKVYNFCEIN